MQLEFQWLREQRRRKITELSARLPRGQARILRAVAAILEAAGSASVQIPLEELLTLTKYRKSRFHDHRRALEQMHVLYVQPTEGTFQGAGPRYQIDWQTVSDIVDGPNGPSTATSTEMQPATSTEMQPATSTEMQPALGVRQGSDRCPTGVRQVSDRCPIGVRFRPDNSEKSPAILLPKKINNTSPPYTARTVEGEGEFLELLNASGIAVPEQIIAHARRCRVPLAELIAVVAHFAATNAAAPESWGPGALYHRLMAQTPGRPADVGWIKPRPQTRTVTVTAAAAPSTWRKPSPKPLDDADAAALEALDALEALEADALAARLFAPGTPGAREYTRHGKNGPLIRLKLARALAAESTIQPIA